MRVYQVHERSGETPVAYEIRDCGWDYDGDIADYLADLRVEGDEAELLAGAEPTIYNYPAGGRTLRIETVDGDVSYEVVI